MSILVDRATRVISQGMTGDTGTQLLATRKQIHGSLAEEPVA